MRTLFLIAVVLATACTDKITSEPDADVQPKKDGTAPQPDAAPPDAGIDASSPYPGYTSGSRLKARVIIGTDGSKHFAGWYDSMRKEKCSWGTAADGKVRCLPDPCQSSTCDARVSRDYYSDNACSIPLVETNRGATPQYVYVPANGSWTGMRVHILGTLNPSPVYVLSNAGCQVVQIGLPVDVFKLAAEIAPTAFADGVEMME